MHIDVELVLRRQETVALKMIYHFLLTMQTQLFIINEARNWRPLETEESEMRLVHLCEVLSCL